MTDIIDAEFELTDAEIQRLRADGAQVTVNEDGTTTISWLDQEVKPKENSASGWQKTIHIVAKESCLGGNNMTTNVNPNSLTILKECYMEPALKEAKPEDKFQFMRTGFFCVDTKDTTAEHMVFNRIVSLKSSYRPNK